ncbi:MAG: hypothetical protein ACI4OD_07255 [Selenomonas sp.]
MFLNLLKPEAKQLFMEFAYSLAHEDGNFAESEKTMMAAYQQEMGVTFDYEHVPKDVHGLVQTMAETLTLQEKKIAFFELVGLAMADSDYSTEERNALKELAQALGMTETYSQSCEKLLEEYFVLQKKLTAAVLG